MKFFGFLILIAMLVSCGGDDSEKSTAEDSEFNEFGSKATTSTLFPFWNKHGARIGRGKFRGGYMNLKGEQVIKAQFFKAYPFSEDLGCVQVNIDGNRRYGFIDKSGDFKIKAQYVFARPFSNGRAWVSFDGKKFGAIDKKGNLVTDTIYDKRTSNFREGKAIGFVKAGTTQPSRLETAIIRTVTLGLIKSGRRPYYDVYQINLDGTAKYLETTTSTDAKNAIVVEEMNHLGVYWEGSDSKGDQIYGYKRITEKDIAGKNFSFADKGVVEIEPKFKYADNFINGYARVVLESGEKAYIDTTGNVVFTYEQERDY